METAKEVMKAPTPLVSTSVMTDVVLARHGEAGLVMKEMTQRDMVRSVIPATGEPITNQEIRETVAREFGDRAPTARQIAQTIVGLRRDGELVQVSHGVQQATDLLGHPRIPSDPTRSRARS